MLKNVDKRKVYGVLGFAAGYYVGRNFDLYFSFKFDRKGTK